MIMLLVFTFSMSTTVISKRKMFFFDRHEKVTIAVSAYENLDRQFGAFSKISTNYITY